MWDLDVFCHVLNNIYNKQVHYLLLNMHYHLHFYLPTYHHPKQGRHDIMT